MDDLTLFSRQPYRRRTWLRQHLPFWLIDLGLAGKGSDCEAEAGNHEWYNGGNGSSCYHCRVTISSNAWDIGDAIVFVDPPRDQSRK